jgi:hypothetical protein
MLVVPLTAAPNAIFSVKVKVLPLIVPTVILDKVLKV